MEDVPLLINYFLEKSNKKMDKHIKGFTSELLDNIMEYRWSGNIRELENSIESGIAICRDNMLTVDHIPLDIKKKENKIIKQTSNIEVKEKESNDDSIIEFLKEDIKKLINFKLSQMGEITNGDFYSLVMNDAEKVLVSLILEKFNGNQLKAAKFLGINRNTLRTKIEKYKL
jgi:DNA-binding NtrC family response regulator